MRIPLSSSQKENTAIKKQQQHKSNASNQSPPSVVPLHPSLTEAAHTANQPTVLTTMSNHLEQARATLGVSASSSMEEARKAYRTMALRTHPDKNPDDSEANQKFQMVQDAWDRLQRCDNDTEYYNSDDDDNTGAEDYYQHETGGEQEKDDEDIISKIIILEMLFQSMCAATQGFLDGSGGDSVRMHRSRRGQRYGRSGGRQRNPFSGGGGFSSRSSAGGISFPFSPSDVYGDDDEESFDHEENEYRARARAGQSGGAGRGRGRGRKKKSGPSVASSRSSDSHFAAGSGVEQQQPEQRAQTSNAAAADEKEGTKSGRQNTHQPNKPQQNSRKKKVKKKKHANTVRFLPQVQSQNCNVMCKINAFVRHFSTLDRVVEGRILQLRLELSCSFFRSISA